MDKEIKKSNNFFGNSFVHKFKTNNNFYIYDVNTNQILAVKKEIYEAVGEDYVKNNSINSNLLALLNNGFLKSDKIKKIQSYYSSHLIEYYLEHKVRGINLQITQNCNFRCEYCTYSGTYKNRGHSKRKMDFKLAKRCIDFLMCHSRDKNKVTLAFYGGEPLLEFKLIKNCVEYIKRNYDGKFITYSLTTNGSLLNENIFKYLTDNKFESFNISLDGPKDVHDKHRKFITGKGTFDVIIKNLKMIEKKFPNCTQKIGFNCVLDPINNFCPVNNFFLKYDLIKDGIYTLASLPSDLYATKVKSFNDSFVSEKKYEMFKLLLSKLGEIERIENQKLIEPEFGLIENRYARNRPMTKSVPETAHPSGPCLAGIDRLFVDVDGVFYPCERVSESSINMKIGNIEDGFDLKKIITLINIGQTTELECKKCWAYRFCTLCAAYSDNLSNFSKKKRLYQCDVVRNNVENDLITFCTMKEYGYDFDEISDYLYEYMTIENKPYQKIQT